MDRKDLVKNLKEFKKKIGKKYKVNEIILFGSRATNNYKKESDVDLIVVGRFKGRNNLKRAPPLYLEWELNLPVDFLCFTPQEFEKLRKKVSIVREALSQGIIIR